MKYALLIFLWFSTIGVKEPIPIKYKYGYINAPITVIGFKPSTMNNMFHLTKLLNAECPYEPPEGQKEVLGVIMSRVLNDKFPNTISGVIYQKGQFDGVNTKYFKYTKAMYDKVCKWYLEKYTSPYLFFYNPCASTDKKFIKWVTRKYPNTMFIQNHIFHGKK